jgi:hypothetical protein
MTEDLRDRSGRLLGRIRMRPDGSQELRDPGGRLPGTYHPKSNQTRDPLGRLVGTGNLLTTLLPPR